MRTDSDCLLVCLLISLCSFATAVPVIEDVAEDEGEVINRQGFPANMQRVIEVTTRRCNLQDLPRIADRSVCNKYYVCSGGFYVAQYCPRGMAFDPARQECHTLANVDCSTRPFFYDLFMRTVSRIQQSTGVTTGFPAAATGLTSGAPLQQEGNTAGTPGVAAGSTGFLTPTTGMGTGNVGVPTTPAGVPQAPTGAAGFPSTSAGLPTPTPGMPSGMVGGVPAPAIGLPTPTPGMPSGVVGGVPAPSTGFPTPTQGMPSGIAGGVPAPSTGFPTPTPGMPSVTGNTLQQPRPQTIYGGLTTLALPQGAGVLVPPGTMLFLPPSTQILMPPSFMQPMEVDQIPSQQQFPGMQPIVPQVAGQVPPSQLTLAGQIPSQQQVPGMQPTLPQGVGQVPPSPLAPGIQIPVPPAPSQQPSPGRVTQWAPTVPLPPSGTRPAIAPASPGAAGAAGEGVVNGVRIQYGGIIGSGRVVGAPTTEQQFPGSGVASSAATGTETAANNVGGAAVPGQGGAGTGATGTAAATKMKGKCCALAGTAGHVHGAGAGHGATAGAQAQGQAGPARGLGSTSSHGHHHHHHATEDIPIGKEQELPF